MSASNHQMRPRLRTLSCLKLVEVIWKMLEPGKHCEEQQKTFLLIYLVGRTESTLVSGRVIKSRRTTRMDCVNEAGVKQIEAMT